MIHEYIITNPSGDQLPLTLMRPEKSGLIVTDTSGLGPPKTIINTRENPTGSGSEFNSARVPARNIVFTLRFLASPTIEAARLRTYKYFPLGSKIRIDVLTDAGLFYIFGYVESNDPNIFSPESETVISILCLDPFFRKIDGTIAGEISKITKSFEFPFSNDGNVGILSFGERVFQTNDFVISFDGDIPVGPTIWVKALGGQVVDPSIYFYNESNPGDVDSLNFISTSLADGDYLEIVCEKQNKSVRRYIAATDEFVNHLSGVATDSIWPIIKHGDNLFTYDAESGAEYIRINYEYTLKYSGV